MHDGADERRQRNERKTMAGYEGPNCVLCGVKACLEETKEPPAFCPMPHEPELLAEAERAYLEDPVLQKMAVESAKTEATGYCKATRIEEIMDFAQRMGWTRLGIAHCIGLMREAKTARDIFIANGFEVFTACCKVGAIDKERVGVRDEDKVQPGEFESMCSPVGQAALLAKAGTQFNVVIGLCVGHDSLFFMQTKAPATVLVAKDRVLGHNPVAALYTHHTYYERLSEGPVAGR
jgi:uncharacterized metal-binding protein